MQWLNIARLGVRTLSGIIGPVRGLILALLILNDGSAARAAILAGVEMPDIRIVHDTRLRLNGMGLRSYSIFGIRIYVAALYLEHRSMDANSILHSTESKLLDIRFLRDVSLQDAQKAWRIGFANNCRVPECTVDPNELERFIAAVPAIHAGDETVMVFSDHQVRVKFDERPMGDITDPHFAETLLATFLGPVPPTAALKRGLLGIAE